MILTYPSALDYWLHADRTPSKYFSTNDILPFTKSSEYTYPESSVGDLPLHVMDVSKSQEKTGNQFIQHSLPSNLPANSFARISDSSYIVRPELCFLLAAREQEIPRLVQTANNLCSIYIPDPNSCFLQANREQITSTEQITKYLNRAGRIPGIKKAQRAIKYASDRSNSPVESSLAAAARLPFLLGGFALPAPSLNYYVRLNAKAASFIGREYICCDLVWKSFKVIGEYDSNLAHLSKEQHAYDQKRKTALMMSGYSVVTITWGHLENLKNIETLFLELRRQMGMQTKADRFLKYKAQREETLKALFYNH